MKCGAGEQNSPVGESNYGAEELNSPVKELNYEAGEQNSPMRKLNPLVGGRCYKAWDEDLISNPNPQREIFISYTRTGA